jgi:alkylhydroperoxidase family enzyme
LITPYYHDFPLKATIESAETKLAALADMTVESESAQVTAAQVLEIVLILILFSCFARLSALYKA